MSLREVTFGYFERPVLCDVTLGINEGEIVVITGPTGSGKTTLLMITGGLLRPWKGEVLFMGKPLHGQLPHARRYIGIMFQNPDDMFFNATVLDEIAYTAVQIYGREIALRKARELARKLGIEDLLNRPPHRLSGGQKRLVALAAAIIHDPLLLILDEPFTYLDDELIGLVIDVLRELRDRGTAILMATHDLNAIKPHTSSIYRLRNCRLYPLSSGVNHHCQ